MMRTLTTRVIFALLFCLAVAGVHPQTVVLDDPRETVRPGGALRFLMDDTGTMTADEVYARRADLRPFNRASVQIPRDGALWLLLLVENRTDRTDWIISNTMNVELLERYVHEGTGWHRAAASGNAVPFANRTTGTRQPAFQISIPEDETKTILLRGADLQSSSIQLQISEAGRFWDSYRDQTLLLGLAFGFFCALIIYNAIVFLVNRDPTYLVYALYMIAFAVNQLAQERLLAEYVQPNRPYGFFWFVVFGGLTAAFGLEFFRRLIETPTRMPRADKVMRGIQIALVLLVIAGFIVPGPLAADTLNLLSLIAMGVIAAVLIVRVLKRDRLALACLVGSLLYLAGTSAEIVSTLVPVEVSEFVLHAQLYGALAQVLILAFALGTKTHQIHEEHERVQQAFRSELEKRVRDRTHELQVATERLKQETVTDELTGLYNRKELSRRSVELDKRIERTSRAGERYVVTAAYIDLDDFKRCNDTFGHAFGDELLQRTAGVIREQTRGYDLAFRIGGDEFVIIMPETILEEARALLHRIKEAFAESMPVEAPISMSIGLASTAAIEAATISALLDAADTALLSAKVRGKSTISTAGDSAGSGEAEDES